MSGNSQFEANGKGTAGKKHPFVDDSSTSSNLQGGHGHGAPSCLWDPRKALGASPDRTDLAGVTRPTPEKGPHLGPRTPRGCWHPPPPRLLLNPSIRLCLRWGCGPEAHRGTASRSLSQQPDQQGCCLQESQPRKLLVSRKQAGATQTFQVLCKGLEPGRNPACSHCLPRAEEFLPNPGRAFLAPTPGGVPGCTKGHGHVGPCDAARLLCFRSGGKEIWRA